MGGVEDSGIVGNAGAGVAGEPGGGSEAYWEVGIIDINTLLHRQVRDAKQAVDFEKSISLRAIVSIVSLGTMLGIE